MIILVMKGKCRIVETPWAGRVTRAGRHGRGKPTFIIFINNVLRISVIGIIIIWTWSDIYICPNKRHTYQPTIHTSFVRLNAIPIIHVLTFHMLSSNLILVC